MSVTTYNIITRVFQSDIFQVVEKTVWGYSNGGTWVDVDGMHVITMGGSGTSGSLRFASNGDSEIFLLTLGIHNDKLWTDIVPDLNVSQTNIALHPEYYRAGTSESAQREKQLPEYSALSNNGRPISVNCAAAGDESHSFNCDVVIHASLPLPGPGPASPTTITAKRHALIGKIIGGSIGGFSLVALVLLLFISLQLRERRRNLRKAVIDSRPDSNNITGVTPFKIANNRDGHTSSVSDNITNATMEQVFPMSPGPGECPPSYEAFTHNQPTKAQLGPACRSSMVPLQHDPIQNAHKF